MISRPTAREMAQDWCECHEYRFLDFDEETGDVTYLVGDKMKRRGMWCAPK
jgi:hypothetical protein